MHFLIFFVIPLFQGASQKDIEPHVGKFDAGLLELLNTLVGQVCKKKKKKTLLILTSTSTSF